MDDFVKAENIIELGMCARPVSSSLLEVGLTDTLFVVVVADAVVLPNGGVTHLPPLRNL